MLAIHKTDRIIGAALIGGTASKISGGKFANGAITAAFVQAFNGDKSSANAIKSKRTISAKLLTVRQGIDHSAIWISDDGNGRGPLLYDPAGQEYFPEGEGVLSMRHSDLFSGEYADFEKYIANFESRFHSSRIHGITLFAVR